MRKAALLPLPVLILNLFLFACSPASDPKAEQRGVLAANAMVVSAREEASKIGLEIMEKGGNAFDAMVATELALAVAFPFAGNIGGGGFMVFRRADGSKGSIDYREKAPMAARRDMYLDENGNVIPELSTLGPLAVGVPGTIAGVFAVHEKFGTLPIAEILTPVIRLALQGVVVTEKQAASFANSREGIMRVSGTETLFAKAFQAGDTIKYPALAQTLERISMNGKDEFYRGETAQKLVAFLQSKGGIITLEDLEAYEAKWREPIVFDFRAHKVISMAPPSSGGVTLAQMLGMVEDFDLRSMGHNSAEYIQVLTEAERRAYADRNYYLGDPDFIKIPLSKMLDRDYLRQRMLSFDQEKATLSSEISEGKLHFSESDETTHYSIVDSFGNAVSVTTTLNGAFGSKLYCD